MATRAPLHRPRGWRPPAENRAEQLAALEARRGTAKARGYDADWRRLRADFLARHPLCQLCEIREGRAEPAVEVHHVEPIRLRPDLRLVEANLQGLCKPCHSRLTAAETRRYGGRRAGQV